jgi:signal transduction histidine kinase
MEVGHDCADAVLTVSGGYPDRALGLRLMRARIADLGGSLDIATAGRKSVLTAVLPAPE